MHEQKTLALGKNLSWKRKLGYVFGAFKKNNNRRLILIYHSVGSGPWSLSTEIFKDQMMWLDNHAQVESLNELLSCFDRKGLRVALTFDDGYESVYRVVEPILRDYNYSATVYLNTGHIADGIPKTSDFDQGYYPEERFLTWGQVRDLSKKGWIIGSHGVEHLDLTYLSSKEAERQLEQSKQQIERNTSKPCTHFSYTWGRYNKSAFSILHRNGYHYAVAGHHKPLSKKDNLLALPRINICRDYTLCDFIALMQGKWDYIGVIQCIKGCF